MQLHRSRHALQHVLQETTRRLHVTAQPIGFARNVLLIHIVWGELKCPLVEACALLERINQWIAPARRTGCVPRVLPTHIVLMGFQQLVAVQFAQQEITKLFLV